MVGSLCSKIFSTSFFISFLSSEISSLLTDMFLFHVKGLCCPVYVRDGCVNFHLLKSDYYYYYYYYYCIVLYLQSSNVSVGLRRDTARQSYIGS
jgi:hypothetical protein